MAKTTPKHLRTLVSIIMLRVAKSEYWSFNSFRGVRVDLLHTLVSVVRSFVTRSQDRAFSVRIARHAYDVGGQASLRQQRALMPSHATSVYTIPCSQTGSKPRQKPSRTVESCSPVISHGDYQTWAKLLQSASAAAAAAAVTARHFLFCDRGTGHWVLLQGAPVLRLVPPRFGSDRSFGVACRHRKCKLACRIDDGRRDTRSPVLRSANWSSMRAWHVAKIPGGMAINEEVEQMAANDRYCRLRDDTPWDFAHRWSMKYFKKAPDSGHTFSSPSCSDISWDIWDSSR